MFNSNEPTQQNMNLRYLKKTKSLTILALLLLTLTKVTYSFALPTTSQAHLTLHTDTAWDLYADQFDFRDNGNRIIAAGDVSITTQGTVIFAQEALYDKERGIIEVTGDVRFESKGDILTGERGTFDLNK